MSSALPRTFVLGTARAAGMRVLPALASTINVVGVSTALSTTDPFPADKFADQLRVFYPPLELLCIGSPVSNAVAEQASVVWHDYRREVEAQPDEYGQTVGHKTGLARLTMDEVTQVKDELKLATVPEAIPEAFKRVLCRALGDGSSQAC